MNWVVTHDGWTEFTGTPEFGAPDQRLHLGLLPLPFAGALETASVVVLMLNPGLKPIDYFAEYHVPEYRKALLANLKQSCAAAEHPNLFLDPRFAWHSGFQYWYGRLRESIAAHAARHGLSRRASLQLFSRRIAFLQLYPYHSESFRLPQRISSCLRSAQLARSYAQDVLQHRAKNSETLLLVIRRSRDWKFDAAPKIIHSHAARRAAHLTPEMHRAILDHLPGR